MRVITGIVGIAALVLLIACRSQLSLSPTDQTGDAVSPAGPDVDDPYAAEREKLVREGITAWGIEDQAVIDVMCRVPRHVFVPDEYLNQAYANHPLPIGYGQTISQPYIVAMMTEALDLEPDDVVLEVGAGSGYQAAVLAELVRQVYTIEIIEALAEQAEQQLTALGYDNIEVIHADGYYGLEDRAPFDAIIVTAAPDHVPPPLQSQLADGGKLVIPVGPVGGYQELWLIERHGDTFTTSSLGGVRFVPLTRDVRGE
ncbi:MAG: protein-L-isoaspartate(D-aspartate) O-methyltransferase [Anaerolineae bacterium]|nr:protein-L-isoaspartate(D-aspartate) O-methyltransferase [Anaerolineae bacterium]